MDEQTDVAKCLNPSIFEEETSFLDEDGMNMLKEYYTASYWKMRNNFLDCVEDFVTQESIIGSRISIISKKTV
jgi:hypothetical protein